MNTHDQNQSQEQVFCKSFDVTLEFSLLPVLFVILASMMFYWMLF